MNCLECSPASSAYPKAAALTAVPASAHVERVGVRRQPIGVTCYAVINPGEAAPISIRVLVTRKARNCQNLWITSAGLPVSPMQVTAGGSADAPCSSRGEQSETTGEAAGSAALRRNQSDALATSS